MLSEKAILAHKNSGALLVPRSKVYVDTKWNCRRQITALDIIELQADIEANGLMNPITVRPIWPSTERDLIEKGFEYFTIAGFRRSMALKAAEAELIPVMLLDIQSEFEARAINAKENLLRKDLTLMEEAESIKSYYMAGWSAHEIAATLNKSYGWCQVRCNLLDMPIEIQNAAHAGKILNADIPVLRTYKGFEQIDVARKIQEKRKLGEKNVAEKMRKKDTPMTIKKRSVTEIYELRNTFRLLCLELDRDLDIKVGTLVTEQGNLIVLQKFLAWITGDITTYAVHEAFKTFARSLGSDYDIPDFVMRNIDFLSKRAY